MNSNWMDQPVAVRNGEELNVSGLQTYLEKYLPEMKGELLVEQFPKGFSNLTYLLKKGKQQLILRRPPFGANIKSAHDMSREFNILSKLTGHYSKIPHPLLYCEEESVIGAPFYIMERVNGVILRPHMPKEMIPEPDTMAAIAHSFITDFVGLHSIDYERAGLKDLGKPEGYIRRQVEGWTKRYLRSKTDDIPEMEKVATWLIENMPKESDNSLIHNDFKYDNVVLDANDWKRIIAVLDWEMATLGDPLMDLGTTLGYWINQNDPPEIQQLQLSPTTLEGNPSRGDVAQEYARQSGRDLSNIVFYYVFGLFKISVIVQQIYYRFKEGHTQDKRFAALIYAVRGCGQVAWQSVQKNRIDNLFLD